MSRAKYVGGVALIAAAALPAMAFGAPTLTAKTVVTKLTPESTINLTTLSKGGSIGPVPNFVSADAARIAAAASKTEMRTIPIRLPSGVHAPHPLFAVATARASDAVIAAATPKSNLVEFDGLSHADQRLADNGNQFSLEPPDEALATDGKYVVEAINNALAVYDAKGKRLIAPVSTNRFFNLSSEYNRANGQYGPSLSDPRAFYDPDSKRWFVFEWGLATNASGQDIGASFQFFAVSETSNPLGNWRISQFETTNPQVPGCPCLPDFQQIGFDQNGIYVTHNLFPLSGPGFAGVSIYALSKPGVVSGQGSPLFEFVSQQDFTVHPALVPPKGMFADTENGTQYFLEGLADISNDGTASAVRVFALSNTAALADPTSSITLGAVDVVTQGYAEPFPAKQPDGPRPYATSLVKPGQKLPPVPLLDTGSARFSANPYYANGTLWGVLSTGIASPGGGKSALAYFGFTVSGGATTLAASVASQGVIAAPGDTSLAYGNIAMPVSGRGGIGFSLAGPGNYPSTGFATLSVAGTGPITITGLGAVPLDGFTGYAGPKSQGTERWGDYGASAVVGTGGLWFGNEYAPDPTVVARTTFANFGTAITNVRP